MNWRSHLPGTVSVLEFREGGERRRLVCLWAAVENTSVFLGPAHYVGKKVTFSAKENM